MDWLACLRLFNRQSIYLESREGRAKMDSNEAKFQRQRQLQRPKTLELGESSEKISTSTSSLNYRVKLVQRIVIQSAILFWIFHGCHASKGGAAIVDEPHLGLSGLEEARGAHWSLPNRPSLFSIIRFPNEECFDSSNQSGTCYTAFECKLLGGQPSSPCAAGFGSCCIVSRSCHVSTREKVIYFKNPSYPSTDSDEKFCDLTVEVSDQNVCQLRLDFLDFQLDPPTQGSCRDDYMEISASGLPPQTIPRLCGLNRNQHRKYHSSRNHLVIR